MDPLWTDVHHRSTHPPYRNQNQNRPGSAFSEADWRNWTGTVETFRFIIKELTGELHVSMTTRKYRFNKHKRQKKFRFLRSISVLFRAGF